ncbi:hypothetical protein CU097_011406 [Rhizopus azygosporus]|uniref:Uncharacterized protein n=1 Tax=Rhizopus azygosporus TaxID=86630 RepID=A0A367JPM7_RHIAZ|nr:hypothetical protein CU097_011406 [Rhizopus azygosporus]
MQIKLVILTICASLAAIGFATLVPQAQSPSNPASGDAIAHSAFDANGAPGNINEGVGAISLDDFADTQAEGSIPDTKEPLLQRSPLFLLAYIVPKRIRPRPAKPAAV